VSNAARRFEATPEGPLTLPHWISDYVALYALLTLFVAVMSHGAHFAIAQWSRRVRRLDAIDAQANLTRPDLVPVAEMHYPAEIRQLGWMVAVAEIAVSSLSSLPSRGLSR
jgi:hypothetical protein